MLVVHIWILYYTCNMQLIFVYSGYDVTGPIHVTGGMSQEQRYYMAVYLSEFL